MRKCNDCGQEETEEYLEQQGELIDASFLRDGEMIELFYCESCNADYYSEHD